MLLALLVFVVLWNLHTTEVMPENVGVTVAVVGDILSLSQEWRMFSPRPPPTQFFLSVEGNLTSHRTIELWRDAAVLEWRANDPFTERFDLKKAMHNHRAFKWYEFYAYHSMKGVVHKSFADHVCTHWNAHHPDELLHHLKVYVIEEEIHLDGTGKMRSPVLLSHYICTLDEEVLAEIEAQDLATEQVPERLPGEELYGEDELQGEQQPTDMSVENTFTKVQDVDNDEIIL